SAHGQPPAHGQCTGPPGRHASRRAAQERGRHGHCRWHWQAVLDSPPHRRAHCSFAKCPLSAEDVNGRHPPLLLLHKPLSPSGRGFCVGAAVLQEFVMSLMTQTMTRRWLPALLLGSGASLLAGCVVAPAYPTYSGYGTAVAAGVVSAPMAPPPLVNEVI